MLVVGLLTARAGAPCMVGDWSACAAWIETHQTRDPAWTAAAAQACSLEQLTACAFASVYATSSDQAQQAEQQVSLLREEACRSGEVKWCKHATTGALYVRVGPRHAVFDGGSPAWLSLPDPVLASCQGADCLAALTWSVQRSAQLCPDVGCRDTALRLRETLCEGGYTLACLRKPSKKRDRRCRAGDATACLKRALTGLQGSAGHDGLEALARSCALGDTRGCRIHRALDAQDNGAP